MRFDGKAVVITGAASGIGRATVLQFIAEGATVIAADINSAGGQRLVEEAGERARFKKCDVSRVADIKAVMDFAAEETGGIDVVFNNAGAGGAPERIDEIEADGWDRTMNLLLRSVAMGIRYAVPHMKGRKGASIVNTASVAGYRTGRGAVAYSTAKAGILHLSRAAAADLARHGIRVNSVSPGLINTNIFATAANTAPDKFEAAKPEIARISAQAQPVARAGQPDDIASAVLYLASEAASFMTGADMLVDGGLIMGDRSAWDPSTADPLAQLL